MSKRAIEIDERLYQRSAAKAQKAGHTLSAVVEAYLNKWVGPEPKPPVTKPVTKPAPQPITTTPTQEKVYVVRAGDTLARIALRMYGDAKKYVLIVQRNGITDPGMIRVGQKLYIPPVETAPSAGRRFRFPLNKEETNYYKFGSLYASSSSWAGKPHPGVDFHEFKGANVYAVGEGTVLINRQDLKGYGHYVMIEHTLTTGQKVWSLYGHLQLDNASFTSPPVGSKIKGENVIIGKEGETGYAGIPHVHFEIKKTRELGLYSMINTQNLNQYFFDPYTFIRDPNNLYVPV